MALGAFDQRLKLNESHPWPESYKEASINVCDILDTASAILEQVCGKNNFKAEDVIQVCQMILSENERLKMLKESK